MFGSLLDSIRSALPDFYVDPTANYTLRYVFYRKSDLESESKNACFSVMTGLWDFHEQAFIRLVADETISSCIVEYVCQYDSALCGQVFLVKEKNKDSLEVK